MTDMNWEYLKVHFDEVISEINPNNYETITLVYAKDLEELKKIGLDFLDKDNQEGIDFEFIGEGYYSYSSMGHLFRRIDEIYKDEIYAAIFAMNEFPDSHWGEFEITKRMNEILVHIEKQEG